MWSMVGSFLAPFRHRTVIFTVLWPQPGLRVRAYLPWLTILPIVIKQAKSHAAIMRVGANIGLPTSAIL